jgi:5-(carboxyamino)imidazole ribonucleotide synthase
VLAVIGGGQLARMMAQYAVPLGLPLRLLAEAEGVSAAQVIPDAVVGDYRDLDTLRKVTEGCAVVTFDHEHVPPSTCMRWPRRGWPAGPDLRRSCTPRTRAS